MAAAKMTKTVTKALSALDMFPKMKGKDGTVGKDAAGNLTGRKIGESPENMVAAVDFLIGKGLRAEMTKEAKDALIDQQYEAVKEHLASHSMSAHASMAYHLKLVTGAKEAGSRDRIKYDDIVKLVDQLVLDIRSDKEPDMANFASQYDALRHPKSSGVVTATKAMNTLKKLPKAEREAMAKQLMADDE